MAETVHVPPRAFALSGKWRTLLLLSLAELLAMAVWFSASAVVPALTAAWSLDGAAQAWLTMSVQIGFVVGALASALFNLPDRLPAPRLMALTAALAAAATAAIPAFVTRIEPALVLRFLTGLFLAGVYPVGMKVMATWTKEDRGLGIGLLVGALTLGSAAPHLLKAFGNSGDWHTVLFLAALLSALGAVVAGTFVREGPYRSASPRFNWRYTGEILRQRELLLANLGYLGHMWELFAMWAWVPLFLLAAFEQAGESQAGASVAAFAVIGMGGVGSLLAGRMADRYGRTALSIASLLVSGLCAVIAGLLFGAGLPWLVLVCLIWGFAVVADSAQYSASVSELCRPEYTGTALTVQTSLGFLLTLVTIRMIPILQAAVGWRWTFLVLALGPAVGIWAMLALRRLPAAARLAGGKG